LEDLLANLENIMKMLFQQLVDRIEPFAPLFYMLDYKLVRMFYDKNEIVKADKKYSEKELL